MTATITTANALLKENYTGSRLEYMSYKRRPWWGAVKKMQGFGGDYKPIPLQYSDTKGRSKDFATSLANRAGASYVAFNLTRAKDYSPFAIDTEALMASEGDANAFAALIQAEPKAALNDLSESISRGLFGNVGGSIGVIGSGQGTDTLTLATTSDIVNFKVGDVIVSSATDGTSGAASANTATITAVDRDQGTISAGANFHADFDDGDYLFIEGDFGSSFAGLAAWLPSSAPTSTPFFGVDRSVDPTRLGGIRYDGSGDTDIAGALNGAAGRIMTEGGATDLILMNPQNLVTLIDEATTKTSLDKVMPMRGYDKLPAHLGYTGITMHLASGTAKVMADKHCPVGVAYMLQQDTWCFHSLGKAPFLFDKDGKRYDREDTADSISGRFQVFGNLACSAPGWNARVDISAVD